MARQWILALLQVLGVRAWSNCSDFGLPPYYYSCASEGAPLRCCDGRYQASFHSMCTLPALFRAPICEEVGPTAAPEASELGAVPLTRWPMLMAHDAATGLLHQKKHGAKLLHLVLFCVLHVLRGKKSVLKAVSRFLFFFFSFFSPPFFFFLFRAFPGLGRKRAVQSTSEAI